MKIEGRLIAEVIKEQLKKEIKYLPIPPYLAVIMIGEDTSSQVYVRQKEKIGQEIGASVKVFHFPNTISATEVFKLIEKLNNDSAINGIIIQRPLPFVIDKEKLNTAVMPQKDVDGFHPQSKFIPPIVSAVAKILQWVYQDLRNKKPVPDFTVWLKNQTIVVIGRGETAGRPIANYLKHNNFPVTIAHSKTENMKELCLRSDIIISCVGRSNIVRLHMVTNKTILLGVGMHTENNHLVADYNQEEIAQKVVYYTPVPGGVGPVNVACLFENLVKTFAIE